MLCEKYGKPADNSNTSNGMKIEVENYEYENHSSSLCVTLWKKEKYKRSTLLIDAKRKQPICIDYVQKELPNLFEKVKRGKFDPKGRRRSLSSGDICKDSGQTEVSCIQCLINFPSAIDLNVHRLSTHEANSHNCGNCDFKGKNFEELTKHIKYSHENNKCLLMQIKSN